MSEMVKWAKVQNFSRVFQFASRIKGEHQTSHIWLEVGDTVKSGVSVIQTNEAQLAVIATKKAVSNSAVHRNRVKRRLRPLMKDCTYSFIQDLEKRGLQGVPYRISWILRAHKSSREAPYLELKSDVEKTMANLRSKLENRTSKASPGGQHPDKIHE